LQRVSEASVEVGGERIAEIDAGLLALVAAGVGDSD
jgi:D-Tyr-tRNAtyr deacylase